MLGMQLTPGSIWNFQMDAGGHRLAFMVWWDQEQGWWFNAPAGTDISYRMTPPAGRHARRKTNRCLLRRHGYLLATVVVRPHRQISS